VERIFTLPLSVQAANQLEEINDIERWDWGENVKDRWTYTWGNSNFSSKRAYKLLLGNIEAFNQGQTKHKKPTQKEKYETR